MADLTVVNPALDATPGEQPVPATAASGGDRFAATAGRNYLIRANNADAGTRNIIIDDPTSGVGVVGATTAQNPDVTVAVPNGAAPANQRVVMIAADRFRDSNGWINLAYSPAPTALTVEVYGPI